jgi:hypothetical protein
MLGHACGYALANKGYDTRGLQAYLGHRYEAGKVNRQSAHERAITSDYLMHPETFPYFQAVHDHAKARGLEYVWADTAAFEKRPSTISP